MIYLEYASGPQRGAIKRTPNLKPVIRQDKLEALLLRAADDVFMRSGDRIDIPLTDEGIGCVRACACAWVRVLVRASFDGICLCRQRFE